MPGTVMRFDGVTKRFGDFTAVNDLSFAIPEGGVFGFLGGHGAGKTTSLRMALDILAPSAGEISVLGARPSRENAAAIGFLPEERGLYRKMSVLDTVVYFGRLKRMEPAAAKTAAMALLERLDLVRRPVLPGRAGRARPHDAGQPCGIGASRQRQPPRQRGAGLVLRALEHLAPLGQQQQPVAQPFGVLHHVGREDHRRPAPRLLGDDLLEHALVDRVEAGERLIEEQQPRLVDQRGRHLDFLRQAFRQLVDRRLGAGRRGRAVRAGPSPPSSPPPAPSA